MTYELSPEERITLFNKRIQSLKKMPDRPHVSRVVQIERCENGIADAEAELRMRQ